MHAKFLIRSLVIALAVSVACHAQDLTKLPANTWVEIKYTTQQPENDAERGQWMTAGWNKIVYDPDAKRVLFYDRWYDEKHGGVSIYGNCLFSFDPAEARVAPLKIDNWKRVDTETGGYRTVPLAENDAEPTPVSRHVYHAFDYVSPLKSVILCNGANQTAMTNGKLVGHDECDGAWWLDLTTSKWSPFPAENDPPNVLDDAMAYCPATHAIIYRGHLGRLWILDLATATWSLAKESPPERTSFGRILCYDPPRKRMLLLGGGRLDGWLEREAPDFHELHAFDPKTETITRLADAPTPFYEAQLAYDSTHDLFVTVAVFNKQEHPSGMFAYDPLQNEWREIRPANALPEIPGWHGWLKICYAPDFDCFIAIHRDSIYAFRHAP